MSEVAYPALTEVENIIKSDLWNAAVEAAKVFLNAKVPFFALPVINQITEKLIDIIGDAIFENFRTVVDCGAIRLVNAVHQEELDSAGVSLKITALKYGVTSQQYLKQKEIYREKLRAFVQFGTAT
jgi:hypothetical protein